MVADSLMIRILHGRPSKFYIFAASSVARRAGGPLFHGEEGRGKTIKMESSRPQKPL